MGQTPRVGVEIEVVHWGKLNTTQPRNLRCEYLISEGLMHDFEDGEYTPFFENHHTYGCTCMVCKQWLNEDSDPFPVQFTLEYDGTLPMFGGEFITSPFPMFDEYVNTFMKGWNIVTDGAIRQFDIPSKNHDTSSPSVHVHASCFNPNNYNPNTVNDFVKAFAPEIYIMGLASGLDRGYEYRHIDYSNPAAKDYAHHRVLNVQHMRIPPNPNAKQNYGEMYPNAITDASGRLWAGPHIEVRTWEADYNNPDYIYAALHASAGLAQVMSSDKIVNKMLGYTMLRDDRRFDPKTFKSTKDVINVADPNLFKVLMTAIKNVSYIAFWPEAMDYMNWLEANVELEVF